MDVDHEQEKNITGALVRTLRKRHGWTQKEFSKKLQKAGWDKCTRSWLSRIESGAVSVRDLHLPYFLLILGEEFEIEFQTVISREADRKSGERRRTVLPIPLAGCLLLGALILFFFG